MIDTDKYEGHTLEYGMHSVRLLEHLNTEPNRRLVADAPLLLAEVERLREVIDKEHPTFDWASRQMIANLEAEVKRLREVMIYVEQMQPHPALEWALKEGLTLTEIKERIE